MKSVKRHFSALVLGLYVVGCHSSGMAGSDPVAGRAFAEKACVHCHVVTGDESFTATLTKYLNPDTHGPDFSAIAAVPSNTEEKLRAFLMTTHRDVGKQVGMPNPVLANYQIDNIVSFIVSLRDEP